MNVDGVPFRTVWREPGDGSGASAVRIIDQRRLPFRFVTVPLRSVDEAAEAIREMMVRGAGCIGATAGYAMAMGMAEAAEEAAGRCEEAFRAGVESARQRLLATRPTAANLRWAVDRVFRRVLDSDHAGDPERRVESAWREADAIADEDVEACRAIGRHGLDLVRRAAADKAAPGEPVRILTHCNAGWLAFVDVGSATAPIYAARDAGIPVEVWVDETRPRNQGARLTAWELRSEGIPCQVIADNAGGHLMQRGLVDLVIVGTDRTTATGDVANKIGTYLKALAAFDNGIPFLVAAPSSSIDWRMRDGLREIPIESRSADEMIRAEVITDAGSVMEASLMPPDTPVDNPAFDVTPARLVTALITERGVCEPDETALLRLFPEQGT